MGLIDRLDQLADRGSLQAIFEDGIKAIQERFKEDRERRERQERTLMLDMRDSAHAGRPEIPQSRGDDARGADHPRFDERRDEHRTKSRSSGDRPRQSSPDGWGRDRGGW